MVDIEILKSLAEETNLENKKFREFSKIGPGSEVGKSDFNQMCE